MISLLNMDKDIFCCEICFVLFSTTDSPRMLPCGHSCCTSCVTKIIATNKKCHMCRRTLTEADVQKYPVNFYILRACDKFYNKKRRIERAHQRLTTTMDKHAKVVELVQAKTVKLDKLTIDGRKLQELSLIKGSSFNVIKVDAVIDDIEKHLTDVVKTFHVDFNTDSECKIDLHSSQCSESKEFLAKFHDLQRYLLPLNKVLYGFLLLDYDPKEAPHLAVID